MTTTRAGPARAIATGVAAVVALGVLVAGGVFALREVVGQLPGEPACTAEVGDTTVSLDLEQARYAATIAAVSVRRGMPARAASIALAAAYQESKILNIDYGDRDSLGLFQQRPSQGWGSPRQILDPYYSTNRFYSALDQVDGYEGLPIDQAAQQVQRSADGSAYAAYEPDARALASALTGYSPGAFSCEVDEPAATGEQAGDAGLTPTAEALRAEVAAAFGRLPAGGFAPGGVRTGHAAGSAHYSGQAIDYFFRPETPATNRAGWALAQFLVAQADHLSVATVIFDDRIWTASRSGEGWREYDEPDGSGDPDVLRHLDHVHVDVA